MKKICFIFILVSQFLSGFSQENTETITCTRNIKVQENDLLVSITIVKPAKGGFARIYEKLPNGSSVSQVKCGKAIYKSEKNMLKIVWENIPESTEIEISYRLKLIESLPDTVSAISGTFSSEFIEGADENISINSGSFSRPEKNHVAEIKKIEEPIIPEVAKEKNITADINEEKVNVTPNENGTYICIQVAAVGYVVNKDYLSKTFGYTGEFDTHHDDNIYRLTVGRFKSQSEAEAVMNEYKSKYFKKCFLSAYHNGKKIAVYEAIRLLQ